MAIWAAETRVWCSEKGEGKGAEMDLWARRRATVLLMVRRWWGRMSAFSSEGRESMSERGMSSSSWSEADPSPRMGSFPLEVGGGTEAASSIASCSLSLSLSSMREVSIYFDLV